MPNQLLCFHPYMEVSKVEFCLPLKTGSILLGDTSFAPSLKAKQCSNDTPTHLKVLYNYLHADVFCSISSAPTLFPLQFNLNYL